MPGTKVCMNNKPNALFDTELSSKKDLKYSNIIPCYNIRTIERSFPALAQWTDCVKMPPVKRTASQTERNSHQKSNVIPTYHSSYHVIENTANESHRGSRANREKTSDSWDI